MNEGEGVSVPAEALQQGHDAQQAAAGASSTAGTMLRNIRERAGIEAAIVASALKISPQTLQALEEDRYDALPDLAFARGLASSICRNFGADPKPVLAQMPSAHATTDLAAAEHSINAPFRSASDRPGAFLPKYISRPLTVIVALFLLGSLLLWLWPTLPIHLGETEQEVQTTALPTLSSTVVDGSVLQETPASANNRRRETQASAVDEAASAAENEAPEATTAGSDADHETENVAGDDAANGDAEEAVAAEAAASSDGDQDNTAVGGMDAGAAETAQKNDTDGDAGEQSAAAGVAASDDLVIEAVSDESWISVHDGSGKTLYNALLPRGETARISGDKPLSATIGRKNAVTVLVHGQSFDHRSLGSSSIARFEVD